MLMRKINQEKGGLMVTGRWTGVQSEDSPNEETLEQTPGEVGEHMVQLSGAPSCARPILGREDSK